MNLLVPVSIGELLDKITILQIKKERISDLAKLKNVEKELGALVGVTAQQGISLEGELMRKLKAVNEQLWEIEDEIREKERAKEFDARFIELARAVYVTNDQRAHLKNDLSKLHGSELFEEKSYKPY
jgi:hypothetical protein